MPYQLIPDHLTRSFLFAAMNKNNYTYEFYRRVRYGESQFIGSLIERRTNPERISCASIMNWVKQLAFIDVFDDRVFFVRVEV